MIKLVAIGVLVITIGAAISKAQCALATNAARFEVANEVQELAEHGDWKGARAATEQILRSCQSGLQGSSCRKLNNFTLGYLAQREALDCDLQSDERKDLLQQALNYYQTVLSEPPADAPTLNNLAVVDQQLGDVAGATNAWQNAIEIDHDSAWLYALRLGDLFFSQNHTEEARVQYEHAANFSPDAETPRERLIETYRTANDTDLQQLMPILFQIEGLFPRVARRGYELLIAREYSEEPERADQALTRWTIVMSRQGWISADGLDAFPQNWKASSVTELRRYWVNPAESPLPWHWWLSNDELRHVVLDVSLVAGRQLVENQQPEEAARCWELALGLAKDLRGNGPVVAPGVPSIPSPLLIESELELLHFQYPKLKGGFHDFMQLLKGYENAVNDQNLPEVQEYHTLMGMIFAAQAKWILSGVPLPLPQLGLGVARWGALAELGAALKVAEQREQREGFYQPLPEIKARLAQGFQAKKRTIDAQQMYLRAASAYLDADSLPDSAKMLESYKETGGSGDEAISLDELIRYRTDLPPDKPSEQRDPWLFKVSPLLDQAFLRRQRFKVYADLAANDSLRNSERLDYALHAYTLVVKENASLVGPGDLLRWEKVTATLLEVGNVQPLPIRPLQGAELLGAEPANGGSGGITIFSFPGDLSPIAVAFSRETQTAAAIVAAIGPTNALVLKDYVRVRNGQVFLPAGTLPPEVNSIIRSLEQAGAVKVNTSSGVPMADLERGLELPIYVID